MEFCVLSLSLTSPLPITAVSPVVCCSERVFLEARNEVLHVQNSHGNSPETLYEKKNRQQHVLKQNKFPLQNVTCARIQVRGDYKVTIERGWLFHLTCHTRICKSDRVRVNQPLILPDGGSAIVCVSYSHSSTGPQHAPTGGSQICDTILGNSCFIHERKGTYAELVASHCCRYWGWIKAPKIYFLFIALTFTGLCTHSRSGGQ